jgi:hypothetical protein
MKTRALATLSVLALTVAIAPLPTLATDSSAVSYDLVTRRFDPMTAGEFDGRMRLRVTRDGIVNGTFMNTSGQIAHIVGGLTGTKIWLQIGDRRATRQLTYNGTFVHGKLNVTAPHGLHTWTLEGTPAAH